MTTEAKRGETPLRIVELRAENVKRLKAVTIHPDGSMVVIGGKNAQGKTSVLDAIMYALGGKDTQPAEVVRRGEKRGEVRLDLGDLVVRRTFTAAGGGSLIVESPEGARYPSPQAVLDRLLEKRGLDPLAFLRLRPCEQGEALRALTGLDTSDLDAQREHIYADRTEVNRAGKALRARVDAMPPIVEDAPAEEVSAAELVHALDDAREQNEANGRVLARRAATRDRADRCEQHVADLEREIVEARKTLEQARSLLDEAEAEVKALPDAIDTGEIAARIDGVEQTNRTVRQNRIRAEAEAALEAKRAESAALTAKITDLDAQKAQRIAAAKMPVEGLGIDESGVVTYHGITLSEASSAEQLRVSMSMALARNPRLPVVLIRDGSLLDEDSLRLVAEMAEEHGASVWVERVGDGEECSVIIEDGAVRGAEQPEPDLTEPNGRDAITLGSV